MNSLTIVHNTYDSVAINYCKHKIVVNIVILYKTKWLHIFNRIQDHGLPRIIEWKIDVTNINWTLFKTKWAKFWCIHCKLKYSYSKGKKTQQIHYMCTSLKRIKKTGDYSKLAHLTFFKNVIYGTVEQFPFFPPFTKVLEI